MYVCVHVSLSIIRFCLGTIAVSMMQDSVPGFTPIPLGEITTPEAHRRKMATDAAAAAAAAAPLKATAKAQA